MKVALIAAAATMLVILFFGCNGHKIIMYDLPRLIRKWWQQFLKRRHRD